MKDNFTTMYLSSFSRVSRVFRKTLRIQSYNVMKHNYTTQSSTPTLWKACEDGSEDPINVADLYRGDDSDELALRHREFNMQELLDVATRAAGNSEAKCVKILKCMEGQFNKAFLLTMSNGFEIIARLPNPNAGPPFYTVASEVATRQYLRDILSIPIPRIYAWSASPSNPVGAEYILEEKASGQSLGSAWKQLSETAQLDIIEQIVDIETRVASVSFPRHGCLYFENDLKSKSITYEPLDSQQEHSTRFAIGPMSNPQFWKGEKAVMDLDRGPWSSVSDYAAAIVEMEINWASSNAKPRLNYNRSMEVPETAEDYIALLKKSMDLAPFLATASNVQVASKISHPDLHLDNIFFDPKINRITHIIDWQLASVLPVSLQQSQPRMLELSVSQESDEGKHEKKLLDHYYESMKKTDYLRWKIITDPLLSVKTNPIHLVPGCWSRKDLFALRHSLISVMAHWNDLGYAEKEACPINFTVEEFQQHQDEMELLEGVSKIVRPLEEKGLLPTGGKVRAEQYEYAVRMNTRCRDRFIGFAENEQQRELYAKIWPY